MSKKPHKPLEIADKVSKHLRARELGKKHYGRADRLLQEIRKELKPGEEIPLPGGKKAVLVDLYADKDKVFRAHGISRFEFEVVDA